MNDNLHIAKGKNLTLFNPSFIDDYGFTPEEFRVFARIMRRAAGENSLGCFETVPSMAMEMGMGVRSVRRALQVLRACKAIIVIEREGQSHLISFQPCDRWLPKIQLISIREELFGSAINSDRERKLTPVGKDTPVGNDRPPLSETPYKGIPIKSIPKKKNPPKKIVDETRLKTRPDLTDGEYIEFLEPQYPNVSVKGRYDTMIEWCERKSQTPSRLRLLKWLEKEVSAVPMVSAKPQTVWQNDFRNQPLPVMTVTPADD